MLKAPRTGDRKVRDRWFNRPDLQLQCMQKTSGFSKTSDNSVKQICTTLIKAYPYIIGYMSTSLFLELILEKTSLFLGLLVFSLNQWYDSNGIVTLLGCSSEVDMDPL